MRKTWFLSIVVLHTLAACTSEPAESDAARQAEAAEARMDPEAARMVAAADSVRAADRQAADSLPQLSPARPR